MYSNAAAFSSAPVRSTEAPEASTASETPASSMSPAFMPQYAVTAIKIRLTPITVTHAMTPAKYRRNTIHTMENTSPPPKPQMAMICHALSRSSR